MYDKKITLFCTKLTCFADTCAKNPKCSQGIKEKKVFKDRRSLEFDGEVEKGSKNVKGI